MDLQAYILSLPPGAYIDRLRLIYQVPADVNALWRTPVRDLEPCCWLYWSILMGRWHPCHGHQEAAWRTARGDQVRLVDPLDAGLENGTWLGWFDIIPHGQEKEIAC
jgi:hypothetical protein